MKMNKIYKSLSALALVLFLASCEKDFLDVNKNPNDPEDATPEQLLPVALGYVSYDMANQFGITAGLFSQYWTQGSTASQYRDNEQYRLNVTDFNRGWSDIYSGPITDFKRMSSKGLDIARTSPDEVEQTRGKNYAAIGYIMQAYTFQIMTDLFGDVPLTEAGRGVEILSPRYDAQPVIYDSLIAFVDRGLQLLDMESDGHPGLDDLFYHGDMHMWYKFANTLKLKIYLRQVGVREPVANAGITALMNNPDTEFLSDEETAQVTFEGGETNQFNRNPFYQSVAFLGVGNLVGSNTVLNYYQNNSDPRIEKTFVPATTGSQAGQFAGMNQGFGAIPGGASVTATNFALPSPLVGGAPPDDAESGAVAPVIFIADYESYFLQAEAAARGYGSGDAAALYESGITASFAKYGIHDTVLQKYLVEPGVVFPAAGSNEEKVKAIITQKWAAMCGVQNVEAWTEYRRTNYPDFLIVSEAAITGNGQKPARFPYATDEQTRNGNFPGLKDIFEKLWWDVN